VTRATLILHNDRIRQRAIGWVKNAPENTVVEFKQVKRSIPQNDRLWAHLTEVSKQLEWHGQSLPPSDWKLIFMDALNRELRIVPNIEGNGFVNLGQSTSKLTKPEMSDLMELISAFGADRGVKFKEGS